MAAESQTCCTVETPSRLLLFYPESTSASLTSLLPTLPLCKPVGHQLVLGRSSSADVRLNDERMSRYYGALWHDGKDPFVFRVSNLSERKLLVVDGAMLRYREEAEVKEGSVLVLDSLEFKAKVCAGDVVAFTYQVSFVKNVVMPAASLKPPEGKCLMPSRRDERDTTIMPSSWSEACKLSLGSPGKVANPLLSCLRSRSLDDPSVGVRSASPYFRMRSQSCLESVGIEYELPENIPTMSSGYPSASKDSSSWFDHVSPSSGSHADNNKPLNIPPEMSSSAGQFVVPAATSTPDPPSMKPHHASPVCSQTSQNSSQAPSKRNGLSCWFNISPDCLVPQVQEEEPDDNVADVSGLAQQVQNGLFICKQNVFPKCCQCEKGVARPSLLGLGPGTRQQTSALSDMVPKEGQGRESPVENAEWDTDDPNINCYMG